LWIREAGTVGGEKYSSPLGSFGHPSTISCAFPTVFKP
jgi:hypothetical protein